MTEKILSGRRKGPFILNREVCTHIHVSVCVCVCLLMCFKSDLGAGIA
jgi:hypothetical protein